MPKTKTKTKKAVTPKKKPATAKPKSAAKKSAAIKKGKESKQMSKTATGTKKATAPKKAAAARKPAKAAKPAKPAGAKKAAKAAPKKKAAERKGSKSSFKKEILQKLLEAKGKILQEVAYKIKSESNVLKFEIGDIYDIASNERERELTLMLGDRDRGKLSEIEDALERIRDNVYGTCEECGEPIAEKRLRALPAARVCVECQSRNERELKISGGRFEEDTGLGIIDRGEVEDEEF